MKERPILFSGEMVRAILDGRKTQTRRVVKTQPVMYEEDQDQGLSDYINDNLKCPYGDIGDQLWVRETWHTDESDLNEARSMHEDVFSASPIFYRADHENDDGGCKWKPSFYLPRWASRIQLEITGVSVERLNDISENDASCEGCGTPTRLPCGALDFSAVERFCELWESINGPESWDKNPFVWVIEFKKLKGE